MASIFATFEAPWAGPSALDSQPSIAFTPFGDVPPVPDLHVDDDKQHKGLDPILQTFYEGPEKCECCINWVEKPLNQMPEREKGRYERAAICLYKRKNHSHDTARIGGLIEATDEKIVLQSQFLIDLIRPALTESGVPVPKTGNVEYGSPFKELYFSHGRILKISQIAAEDREKRQHLDLLISVMKSLFAKTMTTVSQQISKKTITYAYLWTLFPQNMIVYHKHARQGQDRLYQVVEAAPLYHAYKRSTDKQKSGTERLETGFRVRMRAFAFDGTNFGIIERSCLMEIFEGETPITRLDVYPIGYHPTPQTLVRRLAERGAKVLKYQNMVHCEFEGSAGSVERGTSHFLTGRVVVDPFQFSKTHEDEMELTDPFEVENPGSDRHPAEQDIHFLSDGDRQPNPRSSLTLPRIDPSSDTRPTDEHQDANRRFFDANRRLLVLMVPNLPGYSLKHNRWFYMDVSKLRPIEWMSDPLAGLVFDDDKKTILSSFAQHHAKQVKASTDMIASKGSGLVVLLTGSPGTGKTLSAEAIAEEARLPLYRVMAGELGSDPTSIEQKLSDILDLALMWQCVVLFDEADAFINQRKSDDRVANEIVSIFLRQLEYFRGIIFLTSNRPHAIDAAFRSRCRLHICYPPLQSDSRRKVWELNFDKKGFALRLPSSPSGSMFVSEFDFNKETERRKNLFLSDADWDRLVGWPLSGREIHNVVSNVALWSTVEERDVTLHELENTIELTVPYAKRGLEKRLDPHSEEEDEHSNPVRSRKRRRLTTSPR